MSEGKQITLGIFWTIGVLLICAAIPELRLFSGAIIMAGMVFARVHMEWKLFLTGVWIGIGLSPLIGIVMCFATFKI